MGVRSSFLVLQIRQGGITHDRIKYLSLQPVTDEGINDPLVWDIQPPPDERFGEASLENRGKATLDLVWSEALDLWQEYDYVVADNLATHRSNLELSLARYGLVMPQKKFVDIAAWERKLGLGKIECSIPERVFRAEEESGKSLAERYNEIHQEAQSSYRFFNQLPDADLEGLPFFSAPGLDTDFWQGKSIVITGNFESEPDRDVFAVKLEHAGGKVTKAISGKTDVVFVGAGAGPSKVDKIRELLNSGKEIHLFNTTPTKL
jgi:hypothetical protein